MSFVARLVLGDNEYNVLSADFEVSQRLGRYNLPSHAVEVGLINLIVESGSQSELWEWGMSNADSKSGSIVFYRRDAISPLKTLEFEHAYCVKYKEVFEASGDLPMRIYMTLSPYGITMQSVNRVQPWPGFDSTNNSQNNQNTRTERSPQHSDEEEKQHSNEQSNTAGNSNSNERSNTNSGGSGHNNEHSNNTARNNNSGASGNANSNASASGGQDHSNTPAENSNEDAKTDSPATAHNNERAGNDDMKADDAGGNQNNDNENIPSFIP